jgi:hypothetical protein
LDSLDQPVQRPSRGERDRMGVDSPIM